MAKFVTCGAYDAGSGFSDIHVNPATGDVILDSDLLGRVYMSELAVLDPIPVPEPTVVSNICEYFDCDGIIMSHRNLITLKGTEATYRDYADNTKVVQVIEFSTDMEAAVTINCD